MSVFDEYQITKLGELFNVEVIQESLEYVDSLTPQQRAVLQFIVDNPDEQFLELEKTFSMPDWLVVDLVIDYGAPSDEVEELRELRREIKS